MRIGLDGERGFSLGVSERDWAPKPVPSDAEVDADASGELRKRRAFLRTAEWRTLEQLFVDAGARPPRAPAARARRARPPRAVRPATRGAHTRVARPTRSRAPTRNDQGIVLFAKTHTSTRCT